MASTKSVFNKLVIIPKHGVILMGKNNLAQFQKYQENKFTKRIIHKEA